MKEKAKEKKSSVAKEKEKEGGKEKEERGKGCCRCAIL